MLHSFIEAEYFSFSQPTFKFIKGIERQNDVYSVASRSMKIVNVKVSFRIFYRNGLSDYIKTTVKSYIRSH